MMLVRIFILSMEPKSLECARPEVSKKRKFVADGVFNAELNEFLARTLGEAPPPYIQSSSYGPLYGPKRPHKDKDLSFLLQGPI